MEATILDGKFVINIHDLLSTISKEQRLELIQHFAVVSEVIDEVANQIIDGYTSEGWHGSTGYGGNPDAKFGLDGARMRIAKASGDIAAKEIERLGDALKRAEAAQNKGWDAYHELMNRGRY